MMLQTLLDTLNKHHIIIYVLALAILGMVLFNVFDVKEESSQTGAKTPAPAPTPAPGANNPPAAPAANNPPAAPVPTSSPAPAYQIIPATNIPYFDMIHLPDVNTQADCQSKCDAATSQTDRSKKCMWYNFVNDQTVDWKNCWLKNPYNSTAHQNRVTAVKLSDGTYYRYDKVDIPGFDRPNQPTQGTEADCQAKCTADANCHWYNWGLQDGQNNCWLKQAQSDPKIMTGFNLQFNK